MLKMMCWPLALALLTLSSCGRPCPKDFHKACRQAGCVEPVRRMLENDRSLAGKPDARGNLPLNLAADSGIAAALLDAGADVNAQSGPQWAPLTAAMEEDRGDVVAVLLARGAKVYNTGSLLRDAAKNGRPKSIVAIIESGVGVDSADSVTQATALHLAVLNDRVVSAEALLRKGANPNAALSADARTMGFGGAESGFKTETATAGGATPLMLARSEAMREVLKKYGAH